MNGDDQKSVLLNRDIFETNTTNTPILAIRNIAYTPIVSYVREFDPRTHGYTIIAPATNSDILDEDMIGPNHIDSLGSLRELP